MGGRGREPAPAFEERFRKVVESAPDGVVIARDGIVLYANEAAGRLLAYEPSALMGQPMSIFLDAEALATMASRLEAKRAGARLPPREYRAIRRDGEVITVEISSVFIDYDGAPAVLAFARDATDRVKLRAQLAHADRLAAIGTMAAGVAHEINNPLTFMSLATEMLERRAAEEGGESIRSLVGDIRGGLQRVAAIVRDLRIYGRFEDEAVGPVDLGTVLEAAERITAHELRPRVRVRREHGPLPPVQGVATRLEQVFVNLFLNAAHAIPEPRTDGEIVIRVELRERDLVVDVSDNGDGIPAEVLGRIFEPFFTMRPAAGGTGLGLAICRDILCHAGGDLVATSEPGRGTTMHVTLKTAELRGPDVVSQAPPPVTTSAMVPRVKRRVLVIDDETLIVSLVKRMLGAAYEVVGVTDPEEGVDIALRESFEAIVCDIMMPDVTGMDVYERIARDKPGVEKRILFVSGGAYTTRAREFLERVPNVRMRKPFTVDDLRAHIDEIIAERGSSG